MYATVPNFETKSISLGGTDLAETSGMVMSTKPCCRPHCPGWVPVPDSLPRGWTPSRCSEGHLCWVVLAPGKVLIVDRDRRSGHLGQEDAW